MKSEYRRTATTVSLIRYHFVFCPYRRRKIFDIPGLEERFKEIVREECARKGLEVIALECRSDHVHLFLSALPDACPAHIMHHIKGVTSRILRSEFAPISHRKTLWTRNCFVSTAADVSAATVRRYVDTQKTR